MKLSAISTISAIAVAVAGFAGTAAAADQQAMPTLQVSAADISGCQPPVDALACESFHRWIRANFSSREIGLLFGARTSYPEYLSGGLEQLQKRYQTRLQEYVVMRNTAREHIAAK